MKTYPYTSERLGLRPVAEGDIPFLTQALIDPAVMQYMSIRFASDDPGQEQWDWYSKNVAAGTGLFLAVVNPTDDRFMGVCSLYAYDAANRTAELGYWLLPAYWGKGYALEAVQTTLNVAKQRWPDLHRIEAIIETTHHASRRVLEKAVFSSEGTLREVELKGEKWIDLEVWGLILGE